MTKPNQTAEELSVFQKFARHYPTNVTGIETCNPPEPDIRCSTDGVALAFELVEIIDQDFARANSGMLSLKSEFEQSFQSLSGNTRSLLDASLANAGVFVTYQDGTTLQQRRSVIPTVFKFLESMKPTDVGDFQTDTASSLKSVVKMIRILRGSFNGPSWNITTVGLLSDPTIQRLADKFTKKYSSDAKTIELLAYFQFQPKPLPDFIPIIEDFVRTNIRVSQFSAVWIYSAASDKVLSHIIK
jgi:hypothetical protein